MATAATGLRTRPRMACGAWSAVRRNSSRKGKRTVRTPAGTQAAAHSSMMIRDRLPMPGSAKPFPRRGASLPVPAGLAPRHGSRQKTHICAPRRKRRPRPCPRSRPRAGSSSSGSAAERPRRRPPYGKPGVAAWQRAIRQRLPGQPLGTGMAKRHGQAGPDTTAPCLCVRRSPGRMPPRCQKGKQQDRRPL